VSIKRISTNKLARDKTLSMLSARISRRKSLGKPADPAEAVELKRVNDA